MMLPGRRARSLVADTDLIDQDGEFGARGQLISLQGSTPQTALQAIAHRALRQRNRLGVADFPLSGSLELPRYSGEIRGPTAQSARLRERLDAARRVGSGKDGEVPMLQRQLRFSHRPRTADAIFEPATSGGTPGYWMRRESAIGASDHAASARGPAIANATGAAAQSASVAK